MPTTLPDATTRSRHQRQRLLAELLLIVVAAVYLLLFVWSAIGLATEVGVLFATDQHQDGLRGAPAYNPMEPVERRAHP
jgi:hypothetical protein